MKVLPVRLPEAEHERLRQFCQASGFSMAVVIRALVGGFLDQYAAEADGRSAPAPLGDAEAVQPGVDPSAVGPDGDR
jgi:hypothetical protein